ncbi:MAG: hypothetical protein SGPRY_001127 [Prymnesium sp.]
MPHRRVRSDPTDFIHFLRAQRDQLHDDDESVSPGKRDLSPVGSRGSVCPASKKQAGAHAVPSSEPPSSQLAHFFYSSQSEPDAQDACDEESEAAGKLSKKEVPMWTVEEDLLILQLVEKHGKRWSKIALHLPGRTDNGVRNRWNRMERAQVLRQRRGAEAGYRCRRCGQPKRGHICAALTLGAAPAGDELQQKAVALSKLSAHRMRPASPAREDLSALRVHAMRAGSPTSDTSTLPSEPWAVQPEAAPSPALPPPAQDTDHPASFPPVALAEQPLSMVVIPGLPLPAKPSASAGQTFPGFHAPAPTAAPSDAQLSSESQLDEAQLDDFLEELQLHELTSTGQSDQASYSAFPPAQPCHLLSPAALQQLLMTFAGGEPALNAPQSSLRAT